MTPTRMGCNDPPGGWGAVAPPGGRGAATTYAHAHRVPSPSNGDRQEVHQPETQQKPGPSSGLSGERPQHRSREGHSAVARTDLLLPGHALQPRGPRKMAQLPVMDPRMGSRDENPEGPQWRAGLSAPPAACRPSTRGGSHQPRLLGGRPWGPADQRQSLASPPAVTDHALDR